MSLIDTDDLRHAIAMSSTEAGIEWLGASLARIDAAVDTADAISLVSAPARRRVGTHPITFATQATIKPDGWAAGDAARLLFILRGAARAPEQSSAIAKQVYSFGDASEREVVARALPLLPHGEDLHALALEIGRTNSVELFSALALDNPYPARHYDQLEFNKLVLKGLFVGVDVSRISGLDERADAELADMCMNYIQERLDAERPIPESIWFAMAPTASGAVLDTLLDALAGDDPLQSLAAARALGRRAQTDAGFTDLLRGRLPVGPNTGLSTEHLQALQVLHRG
ncbi:MAG: EboA domain-containing protein [Gammaproteobacteria bacterium]